MPAKRPSFHCHFIFISVYETLKVLQTFMVYYYNLPELYKGIIRISFKNGSQELSGWRGRPGTVGVLLPAILLESIHAKHNTENTWSLRMETVRPRILRL